MENVKKSPKIKIVKSGPYIVSGNVPLSEKIITPKGRGYEYKDGHAFPQHEEYALCRCGKTKSSPYCDGTHVKDGFVGNETASRLPYEDRAEVFEGPGIDLLDDGRCAFARFCHQEHGNVWELVRKSDDAKYREEAIVAAAECPAGRLVAVDKNGSKYEFDYEPSVEILQDPQQGVSGPIFVKGGIPIESADGSSYEVRNRVTLCRCGKSRIKPFCDATHVGIKFSDR